MPTRNNSRKRLSLSFAAGLMMLAPCAAPSAPQEADTSGYVVGRIFIEERPVFDGNDSTIIGEVEKFSRPLSQLGQTARNIANDVHVETREDVIRRELLFEEGDTYDQKLVDESARHLRALRIIGDVNIRSDTLPDHTIDLTVRTHDRWTLNPSMSAQVGGGVNGFGVGVREDNFLGSGQKAQVGYNRLSDRVHPDGGQAAFTEPRLFGSWMKRLRVMELTNSMWLAGL